MNHAKKINGTAQGYPVGAKPLDSYSLRKLRRGQKRTGLEDPGQSSFNHEDPAVRTFEEQIMGLEDAPSTPTITESFVEEVMPTIIRAVTGMRAHAEVLHTVTRNTVLFAASSAGTIFTALRSFATRAMTGRL